MGFFKPRGPNVAAIQEQQKSQQEAMQQQMAEQRRKQAEEQARRQSEAEARARAEAARREQERLAAIRTQKIDDLNKRIEFEKTNPLVERRQSASGRYFEAISPGQKYNVPEGADILDGSFERLPFISRDQYNVNQGGDGGRILGKGKVKSRGSKPQGVLGEDEETLGKKTILGV